ncbi:unnamed protein product [Oreochromis niloticus]|nr:unnamed protein product [Mustela putorius furo]
MVKLQTVMGERAPMLGEALLTLSVGRKSVRCSVWVADLEDCILGLDVLRALDCVIDTRGGTLSFPDGGVVRMLRRPLQPDHPAAHALSERAADSSPDLTGSPAAPKDPLTLTSTAPHAASCPPLLPKEPPDKGGRVSAVRRVWEENCDGLTASKQGLLWQLLLDFKDCFSFSEDDMGRTDLIQHDIDTGDAQPIRMRPRRLPLARQAAAERALREMQRAGLIEPSTSPWASPVVMVPKKVKDEWWFCVDFRPLNKVTKKDPYPLPRIDETLDTVAGSSWFSSLDLRSGYWQVPLAPDARPKTAFITSGGLWQFKVLPFGLCNAPATFERLMDKVLTGIPRGECVVYLDDILVHGASFHAALGALRRVLERVLAAGLKLNPRKCCLMRREVAFLGHRLGAGGVGTMDDKIQAVKDWPTPRSVQELKSFLGLASYYRRFVRGFSCIATPLFHLLQKGVTFQWTAGCQVAFTSLQEALVGAPVLSPPDPTLPFVLDTDASSVGSGAVLAQHRNADALSRRPCAQDGCHYCERKEAQEEDQLVPDVKCAVSGVEERPSCQRLVAVDATEWRHQQEEDADIKPVLGWIEEQRQPQREEIAMLSRATKGLWSMFNALRRHDGVLQRGWKEPGRIVDALVEGMFSRFGVPEVIHTDQGRNFESRVFAAMCEKLGSHKTRTTPLHPQSDGLVERFNRTLAEQLALVTAKHLLQKGVTFQWTAGCQVAFTSLQEALVGAPVLSPPDPTLPFVLDTDASSVGSGAVLAQRKKGRCPKLSSDWVGPCKVLERLGEVVYRVQLPPRGRRVALHQDRLAPYRGAATALTQQGGPQTDLDSTPADAATTIVTAPTMSPVSPGPTATSDVAPPPPPSGRLRSRRHHRPPGHLRDFICPRGRGTLRGRVV